MSEVSSFRGLVESLVRRGLIVDDLDKLFALEDLLQAAILEQWPRGQVAASIASLYARTPGAWERIDRHIRHFLGDPDAIPSVRTSCEDSNELTARTDVYLSIRSEQRRSILARVRAKLWKTAERVLRRMARMSVGSWTALLIVGLVASAVAGILLLEQSTTLVEQTLSDTNNEGPEGPVPEASFPEPPKEPSVTIRSDGSHRLEVPMDTSPSGLSPEQAVVLPDSYLFPAGMFLFTTLFAALGLTWLMTPGAYSDRVRQQRQQAKVLRRKSKEARGDKLAPYLVERFEPFGVSNAAERMDEIATILGRIGSEAPGESLDVERTLAGTVRAGGMPTPALQPSKAPCELLVLVDIEQGDHPYLHGVEWVLKRWRRGGLAFVRYNFTNRPSDSLERCATVRANEQKRGQPVALDAVARRTQGMPLIVFARGTDLVVELQSDGQAVEAQWLQVARAWPRRVFVDLDPRPFGERPQDAFETLEKLQQHKFKCIPFSPSGLEAAALHLAGRKDAAPVYAPLKALDEVRDAIERWLAAVSVVPDPTWMQMEAFRRKFLAEELPDPRYIERALEWVQRAFEANGVVSTGTKDNGVRLALDTFADELLVKQALRDKQRPKDETLLAQARSLLLQQLKGAAPARDNPAYKMWSLKVAYQEAMLEPARADELLGGFLGSEVESEVLAMVDAAVQREKELRDSGALRQQLAAKVRSYGAGGNRVPVGWLRPFRNGVMRWQFWLVAIGLAVGAVGGMHLLARPEIQLQTPDTRSASRGSIPADLEVVYFGNRAQEQVSGQSTPARKQAPDLEPYIGPEGIAVPIFLNKRVTRVNRNFSTSSVKLENTRLGLPRFKVSVINFWASWCTPCLEELPEFKEFFGDNAKGWRKQVQFAAVQMAEDTVQNRNAYISFGAQMPTGASWFSGLEIDTCGMPLQHLVEESEVSLPSTVVLDCRRRLRWARFRKLDEGDFVELAKMIEVLVAELDTEKCRPSRCGDGRCGPVKRAANELVKRAGSDSICLKFNGLDICVPFGSPEAKDIRQEASGIPDRPILYPEVPNRTPAENLSEGYVKPLLLRPPGEQEDTPRSHDQDTSKCGDLHCELDQGESCHTCPGDCQCPKKLSCMETKPSGHWLCGANLGR